MLTLYFRKPMYGGKLTDDMPETWSIGGFTCEPLPAGQSADEGLVANFAKALVDRDGNLVPLDTLRRHDLRNGLADALRAAWA